MSETFAIPMMVDDERGKRVRPPPYFIWPVTRAHREQARHNHGQTLERLGERGGLCWQELRWILTGRSWREDNVGETAAERECKALFPQDQAA